MFLGIYLSLLILSNFQNYQSSIQASAPQTIQIPSPSPTLAITSTSTPTRTPTSTPLPTSTPVPTATPTPIPVVKNSAPSDYESYFDDASSKYGVDKNLLKRIARCESGINPASQNGIYGGMFQFAGQTWISVRSDMGLDTNTDLRFSAKDAIDAAAFKISHGGVNAWAGCL